LEGGDEEATDETEDEDVALHDGIVKKYNGDGEQDGSASLRCLMGNQCQR
jgi:hypothetical protein